MFPSADATYINHVEKKGLVLMKKGLALIRHCMYTSHKQHQKTCSETFNSQREPVHSMGVEVTQPTCTYRQRVPFRAPQNIGDPRLRVFGFVHDLHGLFVDHPKGT